MTTKGLHTWVMLLVAVVTILLHARVDAAIFMQDETLGHKITGKDSRKFKLNDLRRTYSFSSLNHKLPVDFDDRHEDSMMLLAYNDHDYSQHFRRAQQRSPSSQQTLPDRLKQALPYLMQANPASIAVLFGLLIWRLLSIYEVADSKGNTFLALFSKYSTLLILITNSLGFLVTVFKPVVLKNYLKFILVINILREWVEGLFNIFMMITGKAQIREMHFGRLLMNVWWSYLCFSFSKSRWVPKITPTKFEQHQQQQF